MTLQEFIWRTILRVLVFAALCGIAKHFQAPEAFAFGIACVGAAGIIREWRKIEKPGPK